MEIETFTISQDSSATEFPNALVVKSHLKQVDQIVRLMFSYGNYGFSIKILTDVCFCLEWSSTDQLGACAVLHILVDLLSTALLITYF